MQSRDLAFMTELLRANLVGKSTMHPSEWCARNLVFDEPNNRGPFRISGNEYVVDVLNDFARVDVSDEVLVWGSQTRKTGTLMGGMAWCIENDPCGVLWVMPGRDLAGKFSRQRWMPMLRASEVTRRKIPTGANRHSFKTLEQIIGASIFNFVGSHSAANLASTPCRRVIMDEVDKFNDGTSKECDAGNLAEQRTKDQVNPQRWKTSTPTIREGLIWQEYLKGDQRRFYLPCPFCKGQFVLAWSQRMTVLPMTGAEAFIAWDPAAKLADKQWDLDRVKLTAHAVCPHCKAPIGNEHKTTMVRGGEWKPTNSGSVAGYVSRHLSSLYGTGPETTFGKLAVKFLQAKQSLLGLQGFINGDLAEPFESQDTIGDRVELITQRMETDPDGTLIMTVDCQARSPFFWWVIRRWAPGRSDGVAFGSAETWEELDEIQKSHGVRNEAVAVDSGYGARSDADVYSACVQRCEVLPAAEHGRIPVAVGWIPTKGMPGRKMWKDASGVQRPYYLRDVDPFEGSSDASRVRIGLVGFSSDYAKDLLDGMRKRRGGIAWGVGQSMASETYWRHMDGEIKEAIRSKVSGRTVHQWRPRSRHWPNHGLDCEVLQVITAALLGLLDLNNEPKDE